MPKYVVWGTALIPVAIELEVEESEFVDHYDDVNDINELEKSDLEDILIEMADQKFNGIVELGMQGKEIGVQGPGESIGCTNEIEWDDVEGL